MIRSLWCDAVSQFDGELYTLRPSRKYPKPVQAGRPPIYVGGETDAALRRVARPRGRLARLQPPARDGAAGSRAELEKMLADEGRSIDDVDITVCTYMQPADPSMLSAYRDAGVGQLVLPAFAVSPSQARETLASMGDAWGGAARAV